jgi:hypothetical protein
MITQRVWGKTQESLEKNPQSMGKNTVLVITIYSFFLFGIFTGRMVVGFTSTCAINAYHH